MYDGKLIKEVEEVTTREVKETLFLFEENEATIHLFYKGKPVKEVSTLHDGYGEMSCMKNAIEGAEQLAKYYGIDKDSEMSVEIELIVYQIKKRLTGEFLGNPKYDMVGYREEIKKEFVWSTKTDTKEGK